jgi:hypothetical protein
MQRARPLRNAGTEYRVDIGWMPARENPILGLTGREEPARRWLFDSSGAGARPLRAAMTGD